MLSLIYRMVREIDPRLLATCAWNLGVGGLRSVRAFERRRRQGMSFPAFLFLSLTSRCNLRCQGCWMSTQASPQDLDLAAVDDLIRQARREGCRFFGLLGGEPLLYPHLFEVLGRHRGCYFQLFTNGTLLTADVAAELRRLGNATPLVSIEGLDRVSDERRGGRGVFARSIEGLEQCRRHKLFTGVATSVCQSNFHEVATEEFARALCGRGVHYLWYYLYRPVGADPAPELCLSREQIVALRRFMVNLRPRVPLIIVDAYWDHEGRALCPAATGISHHIGPWGDVEPCPPVQFACENIRGCPDLKGLMQESAFLAGFRRFAASATRGCVLLDCPDKLLGFIRAQGARDSSGRETALAEIERMSCRPSHHMPGQEVPETHWAYRFAKRHWFFGFGAYG
ncbi:MAG TPA: radical SAM/SPASM domain-containing protein [Candidatus Paceibacterota bacterium]|nr:radical SAM protein [Verrucomicrobiota bacterium]HOX01103.1 radical SAM/SPASM domain-containing protein [Verrucomicrobiota bacterium]HRZ44049.1 radical SAM/SPASM domain-containing protein [Candidatus Paceibacterota bacterium]HRZ91451.1 radical SAM/SPASM domain-containing protein [Candidatus Paceibacterota bacterium]